MFTILKYLGSIWVLPWLSRKGEATEQDYAGGGWVRFPDRSINFSQWKISRLPGHKLWLYLPHNHTHAKMVPAAKSSQLITEESRREVPVGTQSQEDDEEEKKLFRMLLMIKKQLLI